MKSILLHIGDDDALESRIQVAMDLARAFDGHVTCLQAVSYEVFAPGDFYGSTMAAALPQIKQAAEKLRAKVETDLANEDIAWEWRFVYGRAEQQLFEQAPLHDLIVVGPRDIGEDGSRKPSRMAGELALDGSVPVLVVPQSASRLDVTGPVMIGWNGSPEAAVALRSAAPLLAKASTVYLTCVGEDKVRDRSAFLPSEAAQYLSRHGVAVEIVELPGKRGRIADILYDAAAERDCGMMVMGAYGRSRLAELLLGGVTRCALVDPRLPTLMAH